MQKFLKHWPSYLFVCMMVPGLRYYYGRLDCEGLLWILTPVVRLVRFLSGMDFVYLAGCGYVNHRYRFVVAPSCAGIRFLTIAMGMLIFSFVHRMNSRKQGMVWTLSASAAAYGYTVLVNSIRILLSIHLPRVLGQVAGKEGRLTAERLHTMIGTGVYFVSLLILYGLAEHVLEKILNRKKAGGTVIRPAAGLLVCGCGVDSAFYETGCSRESVHNRRICMDRSWCLQRNSYNRTAVFTSAVRFAA